MPSGEPAPLTSQLLRATLLRGAEGREAWAAWESDASTGESLDPGFWRILPLLHARLSGSTADLPAPVSAKGLALAVKARTAFDQTRYRNALLLAEAATAVAALTRAGIETCALKGAALTASVYRDPALRPMSDADLLVRPKDAAHTIEVLIAEGWSTPRPLGPVEMARFHSAPFTNAAHGSIDLHWRSLDAGFVPDEDASLWEASRAGLLAGEPIRIPSPEELLLHACVGGQRFEGDASVRWMADALAILDHASGAFDWARFEAEAIRCGEAEGVGNALEQLRSALGIGVPDDLIPRLQKAPSPRLRRLAARARRMNPESRGPAQTAALHLETYRDLVARRGVPAGPEGFARAVAFSWNVASLDRLPSEALVRAARRLASLAGVRWRGQASTGTAPGPETARGR